MLERLGAAQCVRIHRSAGINLGHVRALRRVTRGLAVELSNGATIPVSRRKAGEIVELLRQALPSPARSTDRPLVP